ncbi:hypothetical protein T265_02032 [Opisthorchis viverrini]|uniref:Uncharacterized protein n=1 Tax=Opisthorchis viverrini TaxID=6198 RepID=A0A075A7Y7_OPIVI|nr:hypothetical protein T265_02032 [Opisthorchis viverrini]KER31800.1 hypothetical protein T265_02032 [Opisthorchis viverrini]
MFGQIRSAPSGNRAGDFVCEQSLLNKEKFQYLLSKEALYHPNNAFLYYVNPGRSFTDIRDALLGSDPSKMQTTLNNPNNSPSRFGVRFTPEKSLQDWMGSNPNLTHPDEPIDVVDEFVYLGSCEVEDKVDAALRNEAVHNLRFMHNAFFNLSTETFCKAVNLIDRFIVKVKVTVERGLLTIDSLHLTFRSFFRLNRNTWLVWLLLPTVRRASCAMEVAKSSLCGVRVSQIAGTRPIVAVERGLLTIDSLHLTFRSFFRLNRNTWLVWLLLPTVRRASCAMEVAKSEHLDLVIDFNVLSTDGRYTECRMCLHGLIILFCFRSNSSPFIPVCFPDLPFFYHHWTIVNYFPFFSLKRVDLPAPDTLVHVTRCGGNAADLLRMEEILASKLSHDLDGVNAFDFLRTFIETIIQAAPDAEQDTPSVTSANKSGTGGTAIEKGGNGSRMQLTQLIKRLMNRLEIALCSLEVYRFRPVCLALGILVHAGVKGLVPVATMCGVDWADVIQAAALVEELYEIYYRDPLPCNRRSLVWNLSRRTLFRIGYSSPTPLDTITEDYEPADEDDWLLPLLFEP